MAGVLPSHLLGYEETVNGANTIKCSTYALVRQVIATRVTGDPVSSNNGLFFILSDHLGSTSLLTTSNGSVVPGSATWYLPFGGYRGATPTQTITDRNFTGQRENLEIGLLYYNARYYAPGLGRFISADSIVPNPMDPQSLNRFSYTRNNPLRFTDPSGHSYCETMLEECQNSTPPLVSFNVEDGVDEFWGAGEMGAVYTGAYDLGSAFASDINARSRAMDLSQFGEGEYQDITPEDAFLSVMGGTGQRQLELPTDDN
jgi:RHS repeat-associated protein